MSTSSTGTAAAVPTGSSVPSGWTTRDGNAGRFGIWFAAVWLVFLVDSLREAWHQAWSERQAVSGWIGLVATVGFAAAYLAAFGWMRARRRATYGHVPAREAWAAIAVLLAVMLVMVLAIGQAGTAAAVYVAVLAVMCLPTLVALGFVALLAVGIELASRLLPGWQEAIGLTFAVCTAAFAMWGVSQLMLRNADLVRAREENARLVVEEERNRLARDLHDILGHSLTVITVKAELASRLLDLDVSRARAELSDLERLSRDALADVRRAVEGYRDLTLPGELVRARQALTAAGIDADLPGSTEVVPTELRDLFAWAVREGVTNVVRHSGARRCQVRLDASSVSVCDDGRGAAEAVGTGLRGLRERAAAAGAVVVTRSLESGFCLEVSAR